MMFSYYIYGAMAILIMLGCIDYGGNGLIKLTRTLKQINSARKLLTPENGRIIADRIIDSTDNPAKEIFTDRTLVYQLELFQHEVRDAKAECSGDYNCDIDEFFNYELLDQIGNSGLNDHIASALTALGVLGTFIGLTIGLKGFDTSTSKHIMDGVSNLLNGMSFAFTTSIVGITLSIIYSTIYHWIRGKTESSLDFFLDDFRKYVINCNKEISINKIQTSLDKLNNFSDDVISAVEKPMQDMKTSLDKYCEFSTSKQVEALQLMTDIFVERLSEALSHNINNLSDSIKMAKEYNESYIESFGNAIASLQNIAKEIEGVNITLQNTISQYKNVNSGVQKINTSMEKKLRTLDGIIKKDIDTLEVQNSIASKLVNYADNLELIVGQISSQSNLSIDTLRTIEECGNNIVKDSQQALEEQLRVLMINSSDFADFVYQKSNSFADFMMQQSEKYVATTTSYLQTAQDSLNDEIKSLAVVTKDNEKKITDSLDNIVSISKHAKTEIPTDINRVLSEMVRLNEEMLRVQRKTIEILKEIEDNSRKKWFFKKTRK